MAFVSIGGTWSDQSSDHSECYDIIVSAARDIAGNTLREFSNLTEALDFINQEYAHWEWQAGEKTGSCSSCEAH